MYILYIVSILYAPELHRGLPIFKESDERLEGLEMHVYFSDYWILIRNRIKEVKNMRNHNITPVRKVKML